MLITSSNHIPTSPGNKKSENDSSNNNNNGSFTNALEDFSLISSPN